MKENYSAIQSTHLLELQIDRIVLNGFSDLDHLEFGAQLERAIKNVFSKEGLAWRTNQSQTQLNTNGDKLTANASATSIARQVAGTINRHLSQ